MKLFRRETGIIEKTFANGDVKYYPISRIYWFGIMMQESPIYETIEDIFTDKRGQPTEKAAQRVIDNQLQRKQDEHEKIQGRKIIKESFIKYP